MQSPLTEQSPPLENSEDVVFDDSGVSDITSSSNNSGNSRPNHVTDHVTAHESASLSGVSNSEKWAQVRVLHVPVWDSKIWNGMEPVNIYSN